MIFSSMAALLIFFALLPPSVAITEFNYDPVDGRPGYVEIQNTTEHAINLRNWRLQRRQTSSETNRFISTSDLFLEAGAYLVLVADAQVMRDAFGDGPYHAMTRYPTLNRTTADELRLFHASGARVDSIQYLPSVWIRGTAHERRSVMVDAIHSENWGPGYSPGVENQAKPPGAPLRISAIGIKEPDQIAIRFTRRLNSSSLECGPCFQSGETNLMVDFREPDLVVLTSSIPKWTLEVTRLSDLFGNALPDTLIPIRAAYVRPGRHDILLNELFLWGSQPFIEIFNPTQHTFDISGLSLNGRTLPRLDVLLGFHIPAPLRPQAYAEFTSWATLSKTSSGIGIRHPNGTLIDTLRYGSQWVFGPESVSLERISPNGLTNDPANWRAHPSSHSRLSQNVHHQPESGFPQPDIVDLHQNRIRIRFPTFRVPDLSMRVYVDDVLVPVMPVNLMQADSWFINFSNGDKLTIETDAQVIGPMPISRIAGFRALLINEILYQPHQERYSGKP
ncbi:MAG: lamin tail domain-containing protein, partial [Deltaproteobacteria bacterium]|nr:lamin tail domain-containing protein [Deltaproteobacteria bacterium]